MISLLNNFLKKSSLITRRIILINIDIAIVLISNYILNNHSIKLTQNIQSVVILILIFIFTYFFTGQYRGITKYEGDKSHYKISIRIILSLLIFSFISKLLFSSNVNFKILFIYWASISSITVLTKILLRDLLIYINQPKIVQRMNCLIYGADTKGIQFSKFLDLDLNYNIISFIDNDEKLWGRRINDIKINSPKFLVKQSTKINYLFLATENLSKDARKEILNICNKNDIRVMKIPDIKELPKNNLMFNNPRPIQIEDLLGREVTSIENKLKSSQIKNSVVCVTGAAGSIGSELCKQILLLKPLSLIIIDNCEHKLFDLKNSLENELNSTSLIAFLGDLTRQNFIEKVFSDHKVDIVFHAAAYKHVPLVEQNPLEGVYNNVFSTLSICRVVKKEKVKQFVLISSDKAVRPTNIMGVSKRLAELIIQSYAKESKDTIFSMVRFGNVLGSSGSVVPTFKRQIKKGGPITVTHPDVIRYFMTIKEAAQLVIESIELAEGGDLFLLDMGDPISIYELANQMIYLSGLKPKNKDNPNGDIEIKFTGLRPGEKLYEELLINAKSLSTENRYIFKAIEYSYDKKFLMPFLIDLKEKINSNKINDVYKILKKLVPEWKNN